MVSEDAFVDEIEDELRRLGGKKADIKFDIENLEKEKGKMEKRMRKVIKSARKKAWKALRRQRDYDGVVKTAQKMNRECDDLRTKIALAKVAIASLQDDLKEIDQRIENATVALDLLEDSEGESIGSEDSWSSDDSELTDDSFFHGDSDEF